ncbi:uncharacterized protein [Rhodnius prolixus]|uniref:Uncharacterized protein n=1 Tax=Rhodnius prolixus TaxID=13249 RepID=A0A905QWS7_RHOPR
MNNQDTDEMESTVRITKSKIQEKQYTHNLAQTEYDKLCALSETYIKNLEEFKEKKYLCENLVKGCESRILEYEKSEKEFEKEIEEKKNTVANLKLSHLEIQKAKENDDKQFNEDVIQVVEKLCSERELFCKNTLNEELQNSYEEIKAYDQEVNDLKILIEDIKSKCPIFNNTQESIIENCRQQMPFIKEEICKAKFENHLFDKKKNTYESTKSALLQEINKMEQQL